MSRFINFVLIFVSLPFLAICGEKSGFHSDVSFELVSLYNFRGIDYGNSPALQPYLSMGYGDFDFFIWGSQALIAREENEGKTVPFNEIDWGVKYHISTPIGKFSPGFTLYYCPFENKKFFDLRGVKDGVAQGSQTMNFLLDYYLSDDIPVKFVLDYNFFNNPQNPLYMGLSYLVVNNADYVIEPFVGVAKGTGPGGITDMYSTSQNQFTFVNAGVNLTKNLKITNDFTMPISTTLAVQPHTEKVWFVFKLAI